MKQALKTYLVVFFAVLSFAASFSVPRALAQSELPSLCESLGAKTGKKKGKMWERSCALSSVGLQAKNFKLGFGPKGFIGRVLRQSVDKRMKGERLRSRSGILVSAPGSTTSQGQFTISEVVGSDGEIVTSGVFEFPGKRLILKSSSKTRKSIIAEVDESALPGCAAAVQPPATTTTRAADLPSEANLFSVGTFAGDVPVVDIGVFYSPQALAQAGSAARMVAEIELAVSTTNQAYINSNIQLRLNLVHTQLLIQNESGDFNTDLSRFTTPGDGFYDEVHGFRDSMGLDLVSMIVANGSYCGLAWCYNGSAAYGFSVVNYACAVGNLSAPHEWGHNFGMGHDAANGTCGQTNGAGWRWLSFRSIMAYAPGNRVNYFSNPAVSYQGAPTGTATANNASVIELTKLPVAAFRASVSNCTPATPSVVLNPLSQSGVAGSTKQYSFTVVNNDSAACGSTTFTLSSSVSSGWTSSVSSGSVTLSPGASSTGIFLSVTSAANAAPGTYNINGAATDNDGTAPVHAQAGSGTGTFVVQAATPTPTNTPAPPTATPTNTPVPPTATATRTPVPPTATATSTPVAPTATPTRTPTNTPVPPTATPTNTPVQPTATPTNTPAQPTATPTRTPTPRISGTVTGKVTKQRSIISLAGVTVRAYEVRPSGEVLIASTPIEPNTGSYTLPNLRSSFNLRIRPFNINGVNTGFNQLSRTIDSNSDFATAKNFTKTANP